METVGSPSIQPILIHSSPTHTRDVQPPQRSMPTISLSSAIPVMRHALSLDTKIESKHTVYSGMANGAQYRYTLLLGSPLLKLKPTACDVLLKIIVVA